MSNLETNLNVAPYHDDYDTAKRYYRILFVVRKAVQTRELNQVQSIIQEQFRRFGDHVFKDGSIVDGCAISQIPSLPYVRVDNGWNNAYLANNAFDETLHNFLAVSNTGVRASIRLVKTGYQLNYPDTNTLYINYIRTGRDGANNQVTTFTSGETIDIYDTTQSKLGTLDSGKLYNSIEVFTANVAANQTATGNTYAVSVGEGIVYQKGFFVNVVPHTITVRDYSTDVDGYMVGFETQEEIVTYLQDPSLVDPADTTNSNAPGANRLKLEPVLVSKHSSELSPTSDFFPIIEFNGTKPGIQNQDPEYAKLGEHIAKLKYEESGDFYIKPFLINTKTSSNTSEFKYVVNPGIGYVKGDRVELLAAKDVSVERATETDESNANITTLNYGSYVIVNELVGMFDTDGLTPIDLYNTAQDSISAKEGAGSAVTGTKVGTANIRAVLYDSGTKGTSTAQYRAYITNIVMNSGKSFAVDVKALYSNAGSFGPAKADIVLESNRAILKDTSRSSLIFPAGITGIKRLRDSTGTNDTQFYLRDIASATLQANGSATYTLNSPHAGGSEAFFSSVGALSTTNELRVDVILSSEAYTPALTGTVNSTTTGTTLIGTGTTFTTQYKVGDIIRVTNGANHFLRAIQAIANNTHMTVDASIASANATAQHRRYYPQGHVLDLSGTASITAASDTQFTVSTGVTFEYGMPQTTYASYPVLRSQAVEAKKNVKKSRYVKINCGTAGRTGPWNLGLTDVYAIEAVYVGTSYSASNPNRSAWFTLNNGQLETHYDHAKLAIKPNYRSGVTTSTRILVKLSYFEHDTTTGIGFFSADSYPARLPGVAANTTNISFAEIPVFQGVELRDCIDFRPSKYNTAADATAIGSATENPAASNTSFVVAASGSYLGEPDTNFQADIEYYLPRIDMIQVNRQGQFSVIKSAAAANPKAPAAAGDAMALATAYVPPFPSLTTSEASLYKKTNKILPVMTGNRGYTMKDINTLDQRITRLEYYQTLSLLESQAKDYTIRDENGLDRFKNGIFADPFNDHSLGNITNFEYAIAIDPRETIARPKIENNAADLKIASKANTVVRGQLLNLPYTSKLHIAQSLASKVRNATESVWNWSGSVSLYPSYDHYRDDKQAPEVNVTIDMKSAWDQFAATPFASNFGDWRVTDTDVSVQSAVSSRTRALDRFGSTRTDTTTTTTTTTVNTLQQTNQSLRVGSKSTSYDLGSYVTDFAINPFMRSREVAFIAGGLKPNSRFWVYFDSEPVSQYCAPGTVVESLFNKTTGTINLEEGQESRVVRRTGAWGAQLTTDSDGDLAGVFLIPEGQFRVGDRELMIANVDDLVVGEDAISSAARAMYTASSLSVTTGSATINTIEPQLSTRSRTATRTTSSTSLTQRTTSSIQIVEPPFRGNPGDGGMDGSGDPLGQSFLVDIPSGASGMFLDKIGVYFKTKDPTLGITCVLVEMSAGLPDTSKTIAKSYLKPSQVSTSANGSAETVFSFPNIPYLTAGKYYTFFLMPDGNSPEYLVYMAEIGGTDLITGQKIFSNPNIGVAFTSANSNTWTPLQQEDIKFKIYRCNFAPTVGTVTFWDQDDEYLTVDGFSLANSAISPQVGDVIYTQNSTGGLLTSNTSPFGYVQSIDQAADKLVVDSSRGGFAAGKVLQIHRPPENGNVSAISSNTLIATSTIVSVDDYDYSIMVPRLGMVTPTGTSVSLRYKGIDTTGTEDTAWTVVQAENEREFIDKMRTVKSKSNRGALAKSMQLEATLRSQNAFVSPVLDLRRRSALLVRNIINNDLTDEHTRYGEALTKYVSQNIVLAEGQDAEDIRVFVTGYRPVGTDISCYVKFHNGTDAEAFVDKYWTKMTMTGGESVRSNSLDVNDYREFEYNLPTSEAMQGTAYRNLSNNGIVQYRDSAGSIYVGYKTFAIKLVLTSTREERVPRMRDVRAIALQI